MTDSIDFEPLFPLGGKNDAYAANFTGQSYLALLTDKGVPVGNVTFEPGCRNNWHIHHATGGGGQILLCTDGSGWYQAEGEDPVSMTPGSVVQIPANVKHWHGAKADSWFTPPRHRGPRRKHLQRVAGTGHRQVLRGTARVNPPAQENNHDSTH
jgi:quercetin dioxygenase-like cupin family protein